MLHADVANCATTAWHPADWKVCTTKMSSVGRELNEVAGGGDSVRERVAGRTWASGVAAVMRVAEKVGGRGPV